MINIAINGFGRIGRAAFKIAMEKKDVKVVAINDLTSPEMLAYMLQYDSIYRKYDREVKVVKGGIKVGDRTVKVFSKPDPGKLPWKKLRVDVVLECTGVFTTTEKAKPHIKAGAKHVILSAPAKDDETPVFMQGVNSRKFNKKLNVSVSSNASCTTNCLGPVAEVMTRRFGATKAIATTVHSYTATQMLIDGPDEKNPRRGRAAAMNIIPTSTGAAVATTQALPDLENKFDGIAIRVPSPVVSLADTVFVLPEKTTVEEINRVFTEEAASGRYRKVLDVTEDEVVSTDFIGSPFTSIVDLKMTRIVDGDLVKILSWYDNEWGYSTKLVEQAGEFGKKLKR
ncbi:type I glyceraldehyde-3-phosphate dehydrogenase [Patescibacteria group bacterium]